MDASATSPLLLVDGYNIIGAWPRLTQLRDQHGLEAARQQLIEALTNYSSYQGYRTRIVFDAYARKHPQLQEKITDAVLVYYTDYGQTADTCIERWCAELRQQVRYTDLRLIVATSDQAHRLTVTGYGAEWMSAQRLAMEMNASLEQGRKKHRSPGVKSQSQRLNNGLKPAMRDRLTALRQQLEQKSQPQ
jgi:predicted RNA-binding protein with PIN domain